MAIGENNSNNGNKNQLFESTYYSRVRVKNSNSNLCLSPSFRSGLLVLDISKLTEGFKYDSVIAIHLSPTKARMFADEITRFKSYLEEGNIDPNVAFGVNAGMGEKVTFIALSANIDKTIVCTIGKFDSNGSLSDVNSIELNKDYNFTLQWKNLNENDLEKIYHNNTELDQLQDLCEDFGRQMLGATAYSVIDMARYDYARLNKKIDPIYDKLGIERKSYGNNNGYSRGNNSFLENSKGMNSNHTTMDGIEGLIDEE